MLIIGAAITRRQLADNGPGCFGVAAGKGRERDFVELI